MGGNNDMFQKFKSSINRGVTVVNVKASSSLEKGKIKTHIDTLTAEIERMTAAAGQQAYEIWAADSTDFSALYEQFAEIRQKNDEIAQLQQELAAIDKRDNQILGTPAQAELTAEMPPEPQPVLTCPNCGASYKTAVNFCRKCGTKMQG